jgi:hypothetical protein
MYRRMPLCRLMSPQVKNRFASLRQSWAFTVPVRKKSRLCYIYGRTMQQRVRTMPITADWYDDRKTMIHWKFSGRWTLSELHQVYDETSALCLTVPHWVNAIIDMRDTFALPQNITSTVSARGRKDPINYDMAVVVTTLGFFRAMVNIFNALANTRGKFVAVATLDEAVDYITRRQATLPPPPPH